MLPGFAHMGPSVDGGTGTALVEITLKARLCMGWQHDHQVQHSAFDDGLRSGLTLQSTPRPRMQSMGPPGQWGNGWWEGTEVSPPQSAGAAGAGRHGGEVASQATTAPGASVTTSWHGGGWWRRSQGGDRGSQTWSTAAEGWSRSGWTTFSDSHGSGSGGGPWLARPPPVSQGTRGTVTSRPSADATADAETDTDTDTFYSPHGSGSGRVLDNKVFAQGRVTLVSHGWISPPAWRAKLQARIECGGVEGLCPPELW